MTIPEQLNDEPTQQPVDDTQLRASDGATEIAPDVLEHVAGGAPGGGGVGHDP